MSNEDKSLGAYNPKEFEKRWIEKDSIYYKSPNSVNFQFRKIYFFEKQAKRLLCSLVNHFIENIDEIRLFNECEFPVDLPDNESFNFEIEKRVIFNLEKDFSLRPEDKQSLLFDIKKKNFYGEKFFLKFKIEFYPPKDNELDNLSGYKMVTLISSPDVESNDSQFFEIQEKLLPEEINFKKDPDKIDLFRRIIKIIMPPPNVTSVLHIGHALNLIIQDFQARKHYESVMWVPGVDHAGIATQNVVEKYLKSKGKSRKDLTREEFISEIQNWTEEYRNCIKTQLESMGLICDWSRFQFTMEPKFSDAVRYAFISLYYNTKYPKKDPLIYRGYYLVNWCTRCETALSDDEVIKKDSKNKLYYIRYPEWTNDYKLNFDADSSSNYVLIATSRPETIIGDTALIFNPTDSRYNQLKSLFFKIPLSDEKIQLFPDEYVDINFGTGIVKITPAHDPNDFKIAHEKSIKFVQILNKNGKIDLELNDQLEDSYKTQLGSIQKEHRNFKEKNSFFQRYNQMDRFECKKNIVEDLEKYGYLEKVEEYTTALSLCYRCETVVEPMFTKQWFVKMKPLAEKALEKKDFIKIIPDSSKKVYLHWLNTVNDWCISRQIVWGHQIPVWECLDCYVDIVPKIEVYKEDPICCDQCSSKNIKRDEDVLDTWFSSMLCPLVAFGWPDDREFLEDNIINITLDDKGDIRVENSYLDSESHKERCLTNFLATGQDIIYFWVARMVMASLYFVDCLPFYHVFVHPTIFDKQGRKMSKSLGNGIDPMDVIKQYSLDAMRFTLLYLESQSKENLPIKLDMKDFQIGYRLATKIWNVFRFLMFYSSRYDFSEKFKYMQYENLRAELFGDYFFATLYFQIRLDIKDFLDYRRSLVSFYTWFFDEFCDYYLEAVKVYLNHKPDVFNKFLEDVNKIPEEFKEVSEAFNKFLKDVNPEELVSNEGLIRESFNKIVYEVMEVSDSINGFSKEVNKASEDFNKISKAIRLEELNRYSEVDREKFANELLEEFNKFSEVGVEDLDKLLEEVNKASEDVNKISEDVNEDVNKASEDFKFFRDLNEVLKAVNKFSDAVNKFSDAVNKFSDAVNKFLKAVNKKKISEYYDNIYYNIVFLTIFENFRLVLGYIYPIIPNLVNEISAVNFFEELKVALFCNEFFINKFEAYGMKGKFSDDIKEYIYSTPLHKKIVQPCLHDLKMLYQAVDLGPFFKKNSGKIYIFIKNEVKNRRLARLDHSLWVKNSMAEYTQLSIPIEDKVFSFKLIGGMLKWNVQINVFEGAYNPVLMKHALGFMYDPSSFTPTKLELLWRTKYYRIYVDKNLVEEKEIREAVANILSFVEKEKERLYKEYDNVMKRMADKKLTENAIEKRYSNAINIYDQDTERMNQLRSELKDIAAQISNCKEILGII